MSEFRTIVGDRGLSAHELGRFGERTGGWRIERDGEVLCECPHEVGARTMLNMLWDIPDIRWDAARRLALIGMDTKETA